MLRLTVRQTGTSRLLARVVEHDGCIVVLDYGDRQMIEDAMRRVGQGRFVVTWDGQSQTAQPGPGMLRLLALHYAASGHIVEVSEHG
ncbi:MAG: hypothetical protein AAF211_05215 [Myxococcota bacterium]